MSRVDKSGFRKFNHPWSIITQVPGGSTPILGQTGDVRIQVLKSSPSLLLQTAT